MGKIVEAQKLYNETLENVTSSVENWLSFLKSASFQFKYDFRDKVLIYAQRPDATACAEMEVWNKKVKRYVNKGAKYIFAFSKEENSQYPFRLLFDVADTHNATNTPYKLWEVKPEYEEKIIESLEVKFGEVKEDDYAHTLISIAFNMTMENLQDYMPLIYKYKEKTYLSNLNENDINASVFQVVFSSVSYMLLSRSGLDPNLYINESEYKDVTKFNGKEITTILGTAISDIAGVGLKEIAKTVTNLQKSEKNINHTFVEKEKMVYANDEEKNKGGKEYDENRIYPSGRIQNAQYSDGSRESEHTKWKIRIDEVKIPKRGENGRVHDTIDEQGIEQTSSRGTGNSNKDDKRNSAEISTIRGNEREIESTRPNEMGRTNEQLQIDSRGTSSEGANLRLDDTETQDDIIQNEQNNLKMIETLKNDTSILTEEEQKEKIAKDTSVFTFTQEMIDSVLQSGSSFVQGKFRIYRELTKSLSSKENADFLKNEYGIGGRSADDNGVSVDFNSNGIKLYVGYSDDAPTIYLTWSQVEKRIRELISADRYLNPKEKDEYNDWLDIQNTGETQDLKEKDTKDEDYKLAEEILKYIQNYDYIAFSNIARGNDDETNIELIKADLNDELNINEYIDFFKANLEVANVDENFINETKDLLEKIEQKIPYYETNIGDIAYIGTQEYEIMAIDDERVTLSDTQFPLFIKEMPRQEFDRKIKENPANDKLRTFGRKTDEIENIENIRENEENKIIETNANEVIEDTDVDPNIEKIRDEIPKENVKDEILNEQEKRDVVDDSKSKEDIKATENNETPTENVLKAKIKKKKRNKIEYFDLHPEIPLNQRNNYTITNDELGYGTPKEKFRRNIKAIRVLKLCEQENRYATKEEQEILAQYVGWGGLADAFDERKDNWASEYNELKNLLTEKEYNEARTTTLTSFYTPPIVIRSIYKALQNMGLKQGNILEPSCGIGNFLGMLPQELEKCKMYGIEIDTISGNIARQLYQKNTIAVKGFQDVELPDSFFDVAVGNVPFGDFPIYDKRYDKNHFLIHDYFFRKSY